MNDADEQRLEALEIKVAYQEQTIAQLHEALVAQQRRLDDLGRLCELLRDKLRAVGDPDGSDPGTHEPPPHY